MLRLYRAEVAAATRLTTQAEVQALIREIAAAITEQDHARERASKERLIETHLELVLALASKYQQTLRRPSLREAVQEGNLGLVRAVECYDCAHPQGHFTAYARLSIRHALADAFCADDGLPVRPAVFYRQRQAAFRRMGDWQAFRMQLRQMQPVSRPFTSKEGEEETLLRFLALKEYRIEDRKLK